MGSHCKLSTNQRREKNHLQPQLPSSRGPFCFSLHNQEAQNSADGAELNVQRWPRGSRSHCDSGYYPTSVCIDRGLISLIGGHAGEGSARPARMPRGRADVSCEPAEPIGVPLINYSEGLSNVSRSRPGGQCAEVV